MSKKVPLLVFWLITILGLVTPSSAFAVDCGQSVGSNQESLCNPECPGNTYRTNSGVVEVCCGYPLEGLCLLQPCIEGAPYEFTTCSCSQVQNAPGGGLICADAPDPINFQGCLRMEPRRNAAGETTGYRCAETGTGVPQPLNPGQAITNETFNSLNPLLLAGDGAVNAQLQTPAGIINRVMVFAFPIAGLILLLMILWGGFEMISGATDKKALDTGKQRITAAVIGFFILFVAYWLVSLVEAMFGVKIL